MEEGADRLCTYEVFEELYEAISWMVTTGKPSICLRADSGVPFSERSTISGVNPHYTSIA